MKIWLERSAFNDKEVDIIKDALSTHVVYTTLESAFDCEIAIMKPPYVKKEVLDKLPSLKFIKLLTAGYNTINLAELKARHITLAYAKDVFSIQIAEDVFSKVLYFNRKLDLFHTQTKHKLWQTMPIEHELYGQTIGIIGYGSIGKEIAKRMKAFETKIIAYKRNPVSDAYVDQFVTDELGLTYLLNQADVVVLALPLKESTYHFMDKKRFLQMKQTALFINVARGEVVQQDDLIEVLNQERIRGAALDVTTPEPLPKDHPLWEAKHIFITPHQASASPYMNKRLIDEVIQTIKKYINHETLDNIVNE